MAEVKTKAIYWQRGENIDFLNETDETIEAGQLVPFGEAIGVAGEDIPAKAVGSLHLEGVYKIPKAEGEIDNGVRVCLKDGKAQKHTAGSDEGCAWLGHTVAKAKSEDEYALVKINV